MHRRMYILIFGILVLLVNYVVILIYDKRLNLLRTSVNKYHVYNGISHPSQWTEPGFNWIQTFTLPKKHFHPLRIPIVIFSNYRHEYLKKCLHGLQKASRDIDPSTYCVFVLHRTASVSQDDLISMEDLLKSINFCKVKVLEFDKNNPEPASAKAFKLIWWKALKNIFSPTGILSKEMPSYQGDVFFLEEDAVISPDAMQVLWYALRVKNTFGPNIYEVALGGYAGENVINAHPDTFVVRKTAHFQGMAYAFNVSFWEILLPEEQDILEYVIMDFSTAIAYYLHLLHDRKSFHLVAPTLGRMWHIGVKGLGDKGDLSEERSVNEIPHYERSPRLIDLESAEVNVGIRDLFGFLCPPEKLTQFAYALDSECIWSARNFSIEMRYQFTCFPQPYVRDKCIQNVK